MRKPKKRLYHVKNTMILANLFFTGKQKTQNKKNIYIEYRIPQLFWRFQCQMLIFIQILELGQANNEIGGVECICQRSTPPYM